MEVHHRLACPSKHEGSDQVLVSQCYHLRNHVGKIIFLDWSTQRDRGSRVLECLQLPKRNSGMYIAVSLAAVYAFTERTCRFQYPGRDTAEDQSLQRLLRPPNESLLPRDDIGSVRLYARDTIANHILSHI